MPSDEAIFVNDDLNNSAENRLNHVLFGLFLKGEYRKEILRRLELTEDAIIYKPSNQSWGGRPDFAIESYSGETLGFIESELDKDPVQLAGYRTHAGVPVFSFGRLEEDHDLTLQGLVDIGEVIAEQEPDPQFQLMVRHLTKQVSEAAGSSGKSLPPGPVGAGQLGKALGRALVIAGMLNLGERLPEPGYFHGLTRGPNGLSVHLFSPNNTGRSLSLFYITGGQQLVNFAGYGYLKKYLPTDKHLALEEWADFLQQRLGANIRIITGVKGRIRVPSSTVEDNVADMIAMMLLLV